MPWNVPVFDANGLLSVGGQGNTLTASGSPAVSQVTSSGIVGGVGLVDLTQLNQYTTSDSAAMAGRDTTAYAALNVGSMSAGTSFNDPVTSVLTTKLTDSSTPSGGATLGWRMAYSTQGAQISQAWGANGDMYTICVYDAVSSSVLIDYQLGGTCSNYRAGPAGEGNYTFGRADGNEQIMFVSTGSQLRRYDTSTDSYDDTGDFPYTWSLDSGPNAWLTSNLTDTIFCGIQSGTTVTSLHTSGPTVRTNTVTGLDELIIGPTDTAFCVGSPARAWDTVNNTLTTLATPSATWFHSGPSPADGTGKEFTTAINVDDGGGISPTERLYDDGTKSSAINTPGYLGGYHLCTYWWKDYPAGYNPQVLVSHDGPFNANESTGTQSALYYLDPTTGTRSLIGHHYNLSGSGINILYYDDPHAHCSIDGKLVAWGGNMNSTSRFDAFVIEVPRSS